MPAAIFAAGNGVEHIWDVIIDCKNAKTGKLEDVHTCSTAATDAIVSFALSWSTFKATGSWANPNNKRKREVLDTVDNFLAKIPDHVELSDVRLHGDPLNDTHLSTSLTKRNTLADDSIKVYYNGTMPLTFLSRNTRKYEFAVLFATNGSHAEIGHIAPINSSLETRGNSIGDKSGFNHIGVGGVKVQVRSQFSPMTHTQVEAFMDGTPNGHDNAINGLESFWAAEKQSSMAGFSFKKWLKRPGGSKTSGQFAMEAEVNGFGSNWENNWNWCFGVDQSGCREL
ncbi:hypothetical protein PHISP_08051 [Aspergillus sp. HF37]|nr:hypothetical protein PHISP_08051 [Aspergillus sp. HF37]